LAPDPVHRTWKLFAALKRPRLHPWHQVALVRAFMRSVK
jgi:hypothetical protein